MLDAVVVAESVRNGAVSSSVGKAVRLAGSPCSRTVGGIGLSDGTGGQ
jgi:hypothetical protein